MRATDCTAPVSGMVKVLTLLLPVLLTASQTVPVLAQEGESRFAGGTHLAQTFTTPEASPPGSVSAWTPPPVEGLFGSPLEETLLSARVLEEVRPNKPVYSFVNGDFSEPGIGGVVTVGSDNPNFFTGWEITSGNVDYVPSSVWQAPGDTSFSIDLSGSEPGAIQQTFATAPGTPYSATFWLAGAPNSSPAVKLMQLETAGKVVTFSFDTQNKTNSQMDYLPNTFYFTAGGSETTLLFTSLTNSMDGPVIGNVTLLAGDTPTLPPTPPPNPPPPNHPPPNPPPPNPPPPNPPPPNPPPPNPPPPHPPPPNPPPPNPPPPNPPPPNPPPPNPPPPNPPPPNSPPPSPRPPPPPAESPVPQVILAPGSQLARTRANLENIKSTVDTTPQYESPTPAEQGGFGPGESPGNFTNNKTPSFTFSLGAATAAQCLPGQCVSTCQVDDGPEIPCGFNTGNLTVYSNLTDGGHRMTIRSYKPGTNETVGVKNNPFVVDTSPPVVSVALSVDDPQVSQQMINGTLQLFVVWVSGTSIPGFMVVSEPSPSLNETALIVEGASMRNFRKDVANVSSSGGRRRLLQTGATGVDTYSFEIIPDSNLQSVLKVSVRPGGFQDQAANPVTQTPEGSYTLLYDIRRPLPLLSRVVQFGEREGLTTTANVSILVNFQQNVVEFNSSGIQLTNGTLNGITADNTYSLGAFYILDITIDPSATLIVQVSEDAAHSLAGRPCFASAPLHVLLYEVDMWIQAGVQTVAGASMAATVAGSLVAGPAQLTNAFKAGGLFALNGNLAAPLPPDYVSATQGMNFALFRWGGYSDGVTTGPSVEGTPNNSSVTSTQATADQTFDLRSHGGRRLQSINSVYLDPTAPQRRRILMGDSTGGQLLASNGNETLQTANVTVVSAAANTTDDPPGELKPEAYKQLISGVTDPQGFVDDFITSSGTDGVDTFLRTILLIIILLIVLNILHLIIYHYTGKSEKMPELFVWPSLELTLSTMALVGWTNACIEVIIRKSTLGVTLGSIFLLFPVLYVCWLAYHVWVHVLKNRSVVFKLEEEEKEGGDTEEKVVEGERGATMGADIKKPFASFVARCWATWLRIFYFLFGANVEGNWEPLHKERQLFNAKYGQFYGDFKGRPAVIESPPNEEQHQSDQVESGQSTNQISSEAESAYTPLQKWDSFERSQEKPARPAVMLRRETVKRVHTEITHTLAPFYLVLTLADAVVEAILLTAYAGSEDGWVQLVCLFILKLLFVLLVIIFQPFKEARPQAVETVTCLCGFATVITTMILLARFSGDVRTPAVGYSRALIAFSLIPQVANFGNIAIDVYLFLLAYRARKANKANLEAIDEEIKVT